jgi:RimJ/RimL family protein N-acetyltransferase
MLIGTKVRLRAVERSDYPLLARWLNDADVMLYWGRPGNVASVEEVARAEEEQARRGNSRKYMIETQEGVAIGQIDYYDLDWQARSAWISIMLGEREYWSGGYGSDAMRTLLRYLFEQLALHRLVLTVHASNTRAQRSYRKNGFVEEGVLRDWAFFNGAWVDGILMSVLDSDFRRATASPTDQ